MVFIMTEEREIRSSKYKNLSTKIFAITSITLILVLCLLLIGFNNFNSNKVIYLRFGFPNAEYGDDIPVTRIELIASTTGIANPDEEIEIYKIYQFDLYNNDTDNPRDAPDWNDAVLVFNERIVTDKNIKNFTLIVYIFINDNIAKLTAEIFIDFSISVLSINGFDNTTMELYTSINEINPIFEFLSFL